MKGRKISQRLKERGERQRSREWIWAWGQARGACSFSSSLPPRLNCLNSIPFISFVCFCFLSSFFLILFFKEQGREAPVPLWFISFSSPLLHIPSHFVLAYVCLYSAYLSKKKKKTLPLFFPLFFPCLWINQLIMSPAFLSCSLKRLALFGDFVWHKVNLVFKLNDYFLFVSVWWRLGVPKCVFCNIINIFCIWFIVLLIYLLIYMEV